MTSSDCYSFRKLKFVFGRRFELCCKRQQWKVDSIYKKKLDFFPFYFSSTGLMFVGLHFLYLWLPRWLWAEAILWWLEKSDSSIWGRSGGLLPPRGYPNYPCFVQISRQRHLSASSERSKTCGHCVLAQRYCCQKSSHTTLESYTLSVTCQVRKFVF